MSGEQVPVIEPSAELVESFAFLTRMLELMTATVEKFLPQVRQTYELLDHEYAPVAEMDWFADGEAAAKRFLETAGGAATQRELRQLCNTLREFIPGCELP